MTRILNSIERNFGIILLISAIFSYFFPQYFLWGRNFTDELLMFALFLGSLKIDFSEVFHLKKNFGKMIFFVLLNIAILPLIFYGISFGLNQEIRIGLFLLFAISGAVATPLLASFLRLNILWSTVYVVITSALIPFTLPLLVKILFNISIEIPILEMTIFLAKLVFIPATLAIILKRFFPKLTKNIIPFSGSIGSIDLAFFLAIIVAVNEKFLAENLLQISTLWILFLLFILFLFLFILGFYMPFKNKTERWTNSLMFGNMNNGLVILLAAEFLTEKVLLVVLLSEIPWVLAQPIFQKTIQKFHKE